MADDADPLAPHLIASSPIMSGGQEIEIIRQRSPEGARSGCSRAGQGTDQNPEAARGKRIDLMTPAVPEFGETVQQDERGRIGRPGLGEIRAMPLLTQRLNSSDERLIL